MKQTNWAATHVDCDICGHDWMAVFPIGTKQVDCPTCVTPHKFSKYEILLQCIYVGYIHPKVYAYHDCISVGDGLRRKGKTNVISFNIAVLVDRIELPKKKTLRRYALTTLYGAN